MLIISLMKTKEEVRERIREVLEQIQTGIERRKEEIEQLKQKKGNVATVHYIGQLGSEIKQLEEQRNRISEAKNKALQRQLKSVTSAENVRRLLNRRVFTKKGEFNLGNLLREESKGKREHRRD